MTKRYRRLASADFLRFTPSVHAIDYSIDMHHGGEVPRRHGVHVGQDQGLGQIVPVRFLVLLAHTGEGLDDGGDGLLYPIETARAISGNNYVLKH